jgi:hypothetical protein
MNIKTTKARLELAKSICTTIDCETRDRDVDFYRANAKGNPFSLSYSHTLIREKLLRIFRRPEKLSMEICYGNEKLE